MQHWAILSETGSILRCDSGPPGRAELAAHAAFYDGDPEAAWLVCRGAGNRLVAARRITRTPGSLLRAVRGWNAWAGLGDRVVMRGWSASHSFART